MRGVVIEQQAPVAPPAPNRADVACFVGFVARRMARGAGDALVPSPSILSSRGGPAPLHRWFVERGWTRVAYNYAPAAPLEWTLDDAALDLLLDVPVPIDGWEQFDRLFAWEQRPFTTQTAGGATRTVIGPSYLGAAVRSFFAQGGRRCYVVRVGDPWSFDADVPTRRAALDRLLGLSGPHRQPPARSDRATWKGVGHLYGLPDVSFLCLPDLADVCAAERPFPPSPPPEPADQEVFVECSAPVEIAPADRFVRGFDPPRADEVGFATWAGALRAIATTIQRELREVQLVAAIPLPHDSLAAAREDLLGWLDRSNGWLAGQLNDDEDVRPEAFSSAFVQLVWPWVKTPASRQMPAGLESPDGVLAGVLARSALQRGSYRTAANLRLAEVFDVHPGLRGPDLELPDAGASLAKRVSLLGPTPGGMRVLSDVTTSRAEAYRQASVNRLVTAIVRAARAIGEEAAFDASSPRLWARLRGAMESLLKMLWQERALAGQTERDAFGVRCDRSTTSDRDLEDGRTIVEITFAAAPSIEKIRVVLAVSRGTVSQVAS
jgi:hypothetical protein